MIGQNFADRIQNELFVFIWRVGLTIWTLPAAMAGDKISEYKRMKAGGSGRNPRRESSERLLPVIGRSLTICQRGLRWRG